MKRCPQCNRVEPDDALAFCRADGATLVTDSRAVNGDVDTTKFGSSEASSETETSILPHSTDAAVSRGTAPTTVLPPTSSTGTPHDLTKSRRRGLVLALTAVVLVIVAVGGYFYSRKNDSATIGSIAVLPFVNQNNDANTEYLADGIPESIINSLSQLPNLKVMSRNSAFQYKGKSVNVQAVAKDLNVQSVLTGRVTQQGDGLLINVELINAQDNSQIWGQQYNRKLADVFAVQEEIAQQISEKLRLKLTSTEQKQLAKRPTENLKAFQFYMQGRQYAPRRTREDLLRALSYYQKAIEEDQGYALAYAGLVDVYANLGTRGYIAPIEGRTRAEEAARKALALDDNLAEGHTALAQVYTYFAP